jgi:hypothetical protein
MQRGDDIDNEPETQLTEDAFNHLEMQQQTGGYE